MKRIEGGVLIDPSCGKEGEFDLLIEEGKIKAVDRPGSFSGIPVVEVYSARGKVIFPGLIDVHVHLREPGFEHKETIASGTRAAILGGFTSVAAMANTFPVNDSPLITLAILEKAKTANQARVFPIGAVTKGQKGEELAEIGLMAKAGIRAISDDGMPVMNSALMRRAMEYAKMFDLPVISHAEDWNLSSGAPMTEGPVSSLLGIPGNPNASEEIMVAREVSLCRLTRARVHIAHLSTREGLEVLRRAKEAGLPITAEVTPHHLLLNQRTWLSGSCAHHKMAPPLRSEEDQAALLKALNSGVIDMVASDHAPHGCVDKETEIEMAANGILGLQTTLPLLLDLVARNKMSLSRMVEALTVAPAKLLKLDGCGSLSPGSHADLVVVDLNESWVLTPKDLASKSENTPFMGRDFKGKVISTMVGGEWK